MSKIFARKICTYDNHVFSLKTELRQCSSIPANQLVYGPMFEICYIYNVHYYKIAETTWHVNRRAFSIYLMLLVVRVSECKQTWKSTFSDLALAEVTKLKTRKYLINMAVIGTDMVCEYA